MILDGMHEKELFTAGWPFRITLNDQTDFQYPIHWHKAAEVVYPLNNDYSIFVNGKEFYLQEKDILVISPGDLHYLDVKNRRGKRFFIQFDMSLFPSMQNDQLLKQFIFKTRKFSLQENDHAKQKIYENALKLAYMDIKSMYAHHLFCLARISDIVFVLLNYFKSIMDDDKSEKHEEKMNRRISPLSKLDNAFKYIEENYNKDITLSDVSKACGYSDFYFSRIFKEATERNFNDFLNEYRLKKAETLLANPDISIAQAAYESGFNSLTTFSRVFRQVKGCTPSEYRKMMI